MTHRRIMLRCLVPILRPTAAFCLRHGLKLQDAIECLKAAFLQVANQEAAGRSEKPNQSRLSLMTGVHRRDVARLSSGDLLTLNPIDDVTTRVLGRWQTDKRFRTKGGLPRPLTFEGEKSEFAQLVRLVTKDIRAASVLSELERSKSIERSGTLVYVASESFTPGGEVERGFEVLAVDQEALLEAAQENLLSPPEPRNLQSRTEFDRIRAEEVPAIRRWMLVKGHQLHSEAREFFASHDQDINPKQDYKGKLVKVILGTFGYVFKE